MVAMRMGVWTGAAVLCLTSLVAGNMYDVTEKTKVAPATCTHGCASWASLGPSAASLFAGGMEAAVGAGTSCAQPGKAVNSRTLGAWCFCDNSSAPEEGKGTRVVGADPDHPLDGSTFGLFNIFDSDDLWVSFAYTDVPPGASGAGGWMRAGYKDQSDAMPIRFDAVAGKPHTYLLFNEWPGYQHYVGAAPDEYWLRAESDKSSAMEVQMLPAGQGVGDGEYYMVNTANGLYISFCTSACDNNMWLRSTYPNKSDAIVVKLVPMGPPIQNSWGYCTSAMGVPEQINVQLGGEPTSVVLSFVTFEHTAPANPPVASVSSSPNGPWTQVVGVTHVHVTAAKDRTYYMHFVRLTGLTPRQRVYYKVASNGGGASAVVSDVFSFRAGYADGVTTVDIWGDMGVYEYNNMGNVFEDCANGTAADLAIHLGDHAYNMGESDETRGDGYMTAWQKALANCPWVPVVGNHEYYDGAELGRFLDQTWGGKVWPNGTESESALFKKGTAGEGTSEGAVEEEGGRSTATHALGAMLSRGNQHGLGQFGSTPSNTSRFFSTDFGLIHFVALDLNVYYGVDPCGDPCREAQLAWLTADLAAANANRAAVPWVVAMSHYPFYCTGCYSKQLDAAYYESNEAELYGNANRTAAAKFATLQAASGKGPGNKTVTAGSDASIKDLMPILTAGKVDLYVGGHWHYYESLWPSTAGPTGTGGTVIQKTFVNPTVPVHVTTGNGGPPGADNFHEDCSPSSPDCGSIPATRFQSTAFGYGRLTAFNGSHLRFQQFANSNSSLVDEFTLVKQ